MARCCDLLALLALACGLITPTEAQGGLALDNGVLRVDLDPQTATLTVTDRETGAVYRQPDTLRDQMLCPPEDEVIVPRSQQALELDGRLNDWSEARPLRLGPEMLSGEAKWQLDGERDLSAAVSFSWDEEHLYAAFVVCDDLFVPGGRSNSKWWEADSVEWWVGWDQAGFTLDPAHPGGFLWGEWKEWSRAAVREVADLSAEQRALEWSAAAGFDWTGRPGYIVETATAIGALIQLAHPEVGRRFRLAAGVNDADEPDVRSAQAYLPRGFVHSRTSTYAVAVLADEDGRRPPRDERDGPPAATDIERPDTGTLTFTAVAELPEAPVGRVRYTVQLESDSRDLLIAASVLDGWRWDMPVGRGFLPDAPDAEYVIPYYGNGIAVSADDLSPPVGYLDSFGGLDMPGLGVIASGAAALCIFDTYDYMACTLRAAPFGGEPHLAMVQVGKTDRGERLAEYRTIWHFPAEPTLAAMARRMRDYCAAQGWVRTLRAKREDNPNVDLLMGAPDVWGSNGPAFAQEARAAGVRHMLVSGSYTPDAVRNIVALGYLCGEYDQYVDTDENSEPLDGVHPMPAHIRVNSDGKLATGWVLLDGSHTWYSRCSETAVAAARQKVPRVLAETPYNARFLDVHTAMGLVECYSEEHPCSLADDRANKQELLDYVRGLGMVLGGEHGRAWSVAGLDYQEGMMSCNPFFSWPAGHLVPVTSEEQIGQHYLAYGIGYERRVPFWELAFHDCVVSTWYWGDSIGYHERVRPDITDRKVALTALYGTVPLLWATDLCLGWEGPGRSRFLEAYRNTCKLHEAIGYEPMDHFEYLSADRSVQRTTFGDGTVVTANLGSEPAVVHSGGRDWLLPSNAVVADGPSFHQHTAIVDARRQTYIAGPGYRFLDGHGTVQSVGGLRSDGPLTVEVLSEGHARIYVEPTTRTASVDVDRAVPGGDTSALRLIRLGLGLQPLHEVPVDLRADGLELPATGEWACFDLLYGARAERPDVGFEHQPLPLLLGAQGQPLRVEVRLRNAGTEFATAQLTAYWDVADAARVAARASVTVAGRGNATAQLDLDTTRVDGERKLLVVADTGLDEAIAADNQMIASVYIAPDLSRWPWQLDGEISLGGIARSDPVVQAEVALGEPLQDGDFEPTLVRATLLDDTGKPTRLLPCQFEPDHSGARRGTLLMVLPGDWAGHETLRVLILSAPRGSLDLLDRPPHFVAGVVERETYAADVSRGDLRPVWRIGEGGQRQAALERVVFSSGETGWGEDRGVLRELQVLADGPVRTRIRTIRDLPGDVTVTRTYDFYPRYFTVDAAATDLCAGLFSRVWYAAGGRYEDSAGNRVLADASGRDEGVTANNANPQWYAMYNDRWSHACVALSEFAGQSYWDEGAAIGQCGFQSLRPDGNRYAHVIGGPEESADFAAAWHASLTTPPVLELGGGG